MDLGEEKLNSKPRVISECAETSSVRLGRGDAEALQIFLQQRSIGYANLGKRSKIIGFPKQTNVLKYS